MERITEKQCAKCSVVKATQEHFLWCKTRYHSWCNDCRKERKRNWYLANAESQRQKGKEYHKSYYPKNKEKISARTIDWQRNNKDKYAEKKRRWYEKNKDKSFAKSAKYRASKRNACPTWLNDQMKKEIESFYAKAHKISIETGVAHEVDHIVPLTSEIVCGLHVPWNLQVITRFDNRSKRNIME